MCASTGDIKFPMQLNAEGSAMKLQGLCPLEMTARNGLSINLAGFR